ncbi:MAG: HAD family hydrolase [Deltaproteobacteria bacterium]|nr:MAG: HAD family hydrolase [Deltaproteobacteria bacterium]
MREEKRSDAAKEEIQAELARLGADPERGLGSAEAEARLQQFGPNALRARERTWWQRLLARFWGPIPWMIEAAALLSAAVERWEDLAVILVMLFVNAFVDFYQESKALNAIEVLKSKLALRALVKRDGRWQEVDAAELVPGDILKLKIGNIVPADVLLLGGGDFLQIDQSALTGESLPVTKGPGDEAWANTVVKQGEMLAVVTATGLRTRFGKTVGLVAKAEMTGRSHFKRMVIRVGDFLILVTLAVILVLVLLGISRHESEVDLLIYALVLTISAIPVAMPAVLTVTMAIGATALARRQAIVSRLDAIEELAGVDVLCSDKTGTLTQNRMSLADPYVDPAFSEEELYVFAALASREENHDPIETPIFAEIDRRGLRDRLKGYALDRFVPFNPVSKSSQAMLRDAEGRRVVVMKGAPQVVIDACGESEFDREAAYRKVEAFAENGFRTLAVALRRDGEEALRFVGLLPLFDPPREDSAEIIAGLRALGVEVKMVTGDNLAVARYIARLLDIGERIESIRDLKGRSTEEYLFLAQVLSKALLQVLEGRLSKEEIEKKAQEITHLVRKELEEMPLPAGTIKRHESEIIEHIERANGFAEVYPEDKYFIVEELQKADHIVGMTGDGVNDAPALKKADAGIAVSGATDAARAAADIVLTAPGLGVISKAIEQARITFERMRSYTVFRIAETIRIVFFMGLAIGVFHFYPVTALMIIVLALLNDLPILAIAYDNTRIRRQPIRWDLHEVLVMAGWLGLAGVLSSFALFWFLMVRLDLPLDFVQTVFFAKLVIAGHGTIYNTRIDDWFWKRPWPSWILFGATFSSRVAGTVIAAEGFGLMTPIGWTWAAGMWGYALAWFVFNDAVKMAVLRYYRRRKGVEEL